MAYTVRSEKIEGRASAYVLSYGKGSKKLSATVHLAEGLEGYTSARWVLCVQGQPGPGTIHEKKGQCLKEFGAWAAAAYAPEPGEAEEPNDDPLPDVTLPEAEVETEDDDLSGPDRALLLSLGETRGKISMMDRLQLIRLADRFRPVVERHQEAIQPPVRVGPPGFRPKEPHAAPAV